jgi:hypothetical protein
VTFHFPLLETSYNPGNNQHTNYGASTLLNDITTITPPPPSMLHFTIFKPLKTRNYNKQKQIKHTVITFILLASVIKCLLSELQHNSDEYINGCIMTVTVKAYTKCTLQREKQGHAVAQWLRHYATSRKVTGSRPYEVNF